MALCTGVYNFQHYISSFSPDVYKHQCRQKRNGRLNLRFSRRETAWCHSSLSENSLLKFLSQGLKQCDTSLVALRYCPLRKNATSLKGISLESLGQWRRAAGTHRMEWKERLYLPTVWGSQVVGQEPWVGMPLPVLLLSVCWDLKTASLYGQFSHTEQTQKTLL